MESRLSITGFPTAVFDLMNRPSFPPRIEQTFQVRDALTGQIYPVYSLDSEAFEFQSSNPGVARVNPDRTLAILGQGSTTITAVSERLAFRSEPMEVRVTLPEFQVKCFAVENMASVCSIQWPERLFSRVISEDPKQGMFLGQDIGGAYVLNGTLSSEMSLSYGWSQPFYLAALPGARMIPLRIEAQGYSPVRVQIPVEQQVARATVESEAKRNSFLGVRLELSSRATLEAGPAREVVPLEATRFRVTSSNPAVVDAPGDVLIAARAGAATLGLTTKDVEGVATIRIEYPSGVVALTPSEFQVRVAGVRPAPVVPPTPVGKHLATELYVGGLKTAQSSAPEKLLLSASLDGPQGPTATATESGRIWIHGFVDRGEAKVVTDAVEYPVRLVSSTVSVSPGPDITAPTGSTGTLQLRYQALPDASDFAVLIPTRPIGRPGIAEPYTLGQNTNRIPQCPSPGFESDTRILNGNTDVLELAEPLLQSACNWEIRYQTKAPGTSILTLQSSAFPIAIRDQLTRVQVVPAPIK
jgi:hypothetical protein